MLPNVVVITNLTCALFSSPYDPVDAGAKAA
jgi:hypothetical protein